LEGRRYWSTSESKSVSTKEKVWHYDDKIQRIRNSQVSKNFLEGGGSRLGNYNLIFS
jgi:hypothetical protein